MNPNPDSGPPSVPSTWKLTTPSNWTDEPIAPRRVPAAHPQRRSQSQSLSNQAHAWLARLPPHHQPLATARRHPHVVNRLTELWSQPVELAAYLQELMLSTRPDRRKGFPFEVLGELADLQSLLQERLTGR